MNTYLNILFIVTALMEVKSLCTKGTNKMKSLILLSFLGLGYFIGSLI